jgi:hypothetical protein
MIRFCHELTDEILTTFESAARRTRKRPLSESRSNSDCLACDATRSLECRLQPVALRIFVTRRENGSM